MDRRRKYTERFRRVMEIARAQSHMAGHESITPEHILAAILREKDSIAYKVILNLAGNPHRIAQNTGNRRKRAGKLDPEQIPLSPESTEIIQSAVTEAGRTRQEYIGTEHILVEIIKDRKNTAARKLNSMGINLENIREEIRRLS